MVVVTAVTYLCAWRSSHCHGAALWRVCFADGSPDRYVCQSCMEECTPVAEA